MAMRADAGNKSPVFQSGHHAIDAALGLEPHMFAHLIIRGAKVLPLAIDQIPQEFSLLLGQHHIRTPCRKACVSALFP